MDGKENDRRPAQGDGQCDRTAEEILRQAALFAKDTDTDWRPPTGPFKYLGELTWVDDILDSPTNGAILDAAWRASDNDLDGADPFELKLMLDEALWAMTQREVDLMERDRKITHLVDCLCADQQIIEGASKELDELQHRLDRYGELYGPLPEEPRADDATDTSEPSTDDVASQVSDVLADFTPAEREVIEQWDPGRHDEADDAVFKRYLVRVMEQARFNNTGLWPVTPLYEPPTDADRRFIDGLKVVDPKAWALWRGEWQGRYPSQSEADFGFLSLLYHLGATTYQMQRIFRASGLYREKTDSRRNNGTYLTGAIYRIVNEKALKTAAAAAESNEGSHDVH